MATNRTLHEISSRLDRVFETSRGIEDDEIKAHYARYLCVLTSGYLEEAIKIIIRTYVGSKTHPNVCNYVNLSTDRVTNLKTEKLAKFLNQFNSEWKREFENKLSDEELAAIDSVVANRNEIAHGRNVGVSYVHVRDWYKNVKKAIEKISIIVNS
ncbi:MAG TPA: HEPN domain-containing protein [Anaerolineales bacterium]|nr:HEPN domain-containing protein [Anaerolineales bacterium]